MTSPRSSACRRCGAGVAPDDLVTVAPAARVCPECAAEILAEAG